MRNFIGNLWQNVSAKIFIGNTNLKKDEKSNDICSTIL